MDKAITLTLFMLTIVGLMDHVTSELSPANSTCPDVQVLRGRDGRDGRDGLRGPKGEKGSLGIHGQKGARGFTGAGQKGERGSTGFQGQKGARGFTGTGLKGQKGVRGSNGFGHKGQKGARGYTGIGQKGAQGVNGFKGQKGTRGFTGYRGLPGVRSSSGVTYTQWGHTQCRTGATLLYSGRMGGGYARQRGGGTNFLCMPDNPQFYSGSGSRSGEQSTYSKIYGTEYDHAIHAGQNTNVPCAICYVPDKAVSLMIPGRYSCPSGWTREFYGYLMGASSGWPAHYRSTYECVDYSQHIIPGSTSNVDGAMLFHTEVICHGFFNCPPYDATKEVTCAVCTK